MAAVQVIPTDVQLFANQYEIMIDNILSYSNPTVNHGYYVFYVSRDGSVIDYVNILESLTIDEITYHYTIKRAVSPQYNIPFRSLLIYDLLFNSEDILDLSNIRTNIPQTTLARTHSYFWNGSHINIAPVLNNQRINYHYTEYDVNQRRSHSNPNPLLIKYKFCKFTIPEWIQNQRNTVCYNESPPKIFDQIQGKHLSSMDGNFILNAGLNLAFPQTYGGVSFNTSELKNSEFKNTKLKTLYKSKYNKKLEVPSKTSEIIESYKGAVCKYVQSLAKDNNIKLEYTSVVLFNPFKQKSIGSVILNANIHINDNDQLNSIKKSYTEKIKGYLNKTVQTKEISTFLMKNNKR
jgi:hypothetical protein